MRHSTSDFRSIQSLIYVTHGNIPSRWAHSLQMQHMARAFAQTGLKVELLTQVSLTERLFWSSWRLDAKKSRPEKETQQLDLSENGNYSVRRLITSTRSHRDSDGFFTGTHYPRFYRAAEAYCLKARPDIVFTRSRPVATSLIKAGVRTIVECHNEMQTPEKPGSELYDLNLLKESPNFLGLVTISDVLKESYLRNGYREEQVLVWPDAVDLRPFDIALSGKGASSNDSKFRVGYCGQLYEWKGIGVLLEAAQLLPEMEFEIIGGNPDDLAHWRARAQDLHNVTFHGYVDHEEVPAMLMRFDAVCLPNLSNCKDRDWMSPLKLYEYMGATRAIVASDLPAIRRVLTHEQNALICIPDSSSSLADALALLKNEPALRQRISQCAREQVQSKSWKARAHDILEWAKLTPPAPR